MGLINYFKIIDRNSFIIRALLRDGWRPWAEIGDNEFKLLIGLTELTEH